MLYSIHVRMPAGTSLESLPLDLRTTLADVREEHVGPPSISGGTIMARSRENDGQKIIHANMETDSADPLLLLDALFALHDLDWQVVGFQEAWTATPVLIPVSQDIEDWLADEIIPGPGPDDPGTPVRPTWPVPLHGYAGQAPVVTV